MQAQVNEKLEKKVFKPVTVALNFDNEKDFNMFYHIVGYTISIPELIAGSLPPKDRNEAFDDCKKLLVNIRNAIYKYRNV